LDTWYSVCRVANPRGTRTCCPCCPSRSRRPAFPNDNKRTVSRQTPRGGGGLLLSQQLGHLVLPNALDTLVHLVLASGRKTETRKRITFANAPETGSDPSHEEPGQALGWAAGSGQAMSPTHPKRPWPRDQPASLPRYKRVIRSSFDNSKK
jgi:hypothetical protein